MKRLHSIIFRSFLLLITLSIITNTQAQVLVHEEPLHHPVFQNKEVRILNVLMPPGDTSQYHIHHTPSLFIYLTTTVTGSQLQGKQARSGKNPAGYIQFENLAAPNIRIHRVWNADSDTFHVMDIELLYKDSGFAQKPLAMPGLSIEIDTSWIRAYRLTLSKGMDFSLSDKKQSFVLVSLADAEVEIKEGGKTKSQPLKKGSFYVIKKGDSFSLKNISDKNIQSILLEIPEQ